MRVIPRCSLSACGLILQNLRFLRISIKNEKIPDGRRWCQNQNLYITKFWDQIENLTRTYGSLFSDRSNFFWKSLKMLLIFRNRIKALSWDFAEFFVLLWKSCETKILQKSAPVESLQILDLSGKFLETKILQIPLKPDDRVQRDLRATEPGLTIRRPSA